MLRRIIRFFVSGSQAPIVKPPNDGTIAVETRGYKNCESVCGEDGKFLGKVLFENDDARVIIGSRVFIGGGTLLIAAQEIDIGDDVLIAWGVTIVDHNAHSISFSKRKDDLSNFRLGRSKVWNDVTIAPVRICDKAWIGFNSIVLKGVTIGEGAVVGAGSVVSSDVPPWVVVAGNPARIVRHISPEER